MANSNAPRGFVPIRTRSGSGLLSPKSYKIADNDTTSAIYTGDPVKPGTSGTAGCIIRGTAGAAALGVFAGCVYTVTATGKRTFSKHYDGVTGKTDIVALVYDDLSDTIFEIQATGALAATDVFTAYDFTIAAGSTITGDSATYLAASGDGFLVLGLVQRPDNEWGAYQKVFGMFASSDRTLV